MKIYRCNKCGNILIVANDGGVIPTCCNEQMELLEAKTHDGIIEKHLPVVKCCEQEICVEVGEKLHPMEKEHYIQMIILETNKGYYLRKLTAKDEPKAKFKICESELPITVYEYCNIHSLYKRDVNCEK